MEMFVHLWCATSPHEVMVNFMNIIWSDRIGTPPIFTAFQVNHHTFGKNLWRPLYEYDVIYLNGLEILFGKGKELFRARWQSLALCSLSLFHWKIKTSAVVFFNALMLMIVRRYSWKRRFTPTSPIIVAFPCE